MKTIALVFIICLILPGCDQAKIGTAAQQESPPEFHNARISIPQYEMPKTPAKSKY